MSKDSDVLWVRKTAAGRFEREGALHAEKSACCGGYCGVFWQSGKPPTLLKARALVGERTAEYEAECSAKPTSTSHFARIGLPSRFIVPLAVFVFLQPALAMLLMLALPWGYSLPVGIISALVAWRTIRIVKRHIRTA